MKNNNKTLKRGLTTTELGIYILAIATVGILAFLTFSWFSEYVMDVYYYIKFTIK